MAFVKKTWVDRDTENPSGRLLVITSEDTQGLHCDVSLDEGEVYTEGDELNAENLNDLEDRIDTAFDEIPTGSDVQVEQVVTEGTKIATITVDGDETDIYAVDYSNALILDVTSVGV